MISSTKFLIVLDTNVFVSGILFGGIPSKILEIIKLPHVELLMSKLLANEILFQLRRFHVSYLTYRVHQYTVLTRALMIAPMPIKRTSRDPKDDMLLALSLAGHADYLITGDKDLLVLRTFGRTNIVTPKEFLKSYERKMRGN